VGLSAIDLRPVQAHEAGVSIFLSPTERRPICTALSLSCESRNDQSRSKAPMLSEIRTECSLANPDTCINANVGFGEAPDVKKSCEADLRSGVVEGREGSDRDKACAELNVR
jgi:hypothetical protein